MRVHHAALSAGLLALSAPAWAQRFDTEDNTALPVEATVGVPGQFAPAKPGEWLVIPYVTVTETYTDNRGGASRDAQADLVTQINPGVFIDGSGRRVRATLDADVVYDTYLSSNRLDGYRFSVYGIGEAEAVRDLIYFDGRVSLSQHSLLRSGPISIIERTLPGNQSQIFNYALSPNFRKEIGGWAEWSGRYEFSQVTFTEPDVGGVAVQPSDAHSHRVGTRLGSGERFDRLHWSLTGNAKVLNIQNDEDAERQYGIGEVGYDLFSWLRPEVSGGYEKIDEPGIDEDLFSGPIWSAGARLSPGRRLEGRVRYNHRYGTKFWSGNGAFEFYDGVKLTASANHSVINAQEEVGLMLERLGRDPTGHWIDTETGLLLDPTDPLLDLVDMTYLQDRVTVGIVMRRNRHWGEISGFHVDRFYPTLLASAEYWGGNLRYGRRLRGPFDVTGSLGFSDSEGSISLIDTRIWKLGATFGYSHSSRIRAELSVNHLETANDFNTGHEENALTLRVRVAF
ncbi:MAG: TIGR03016 family PEP-CTERM system-associated outer membrane protein [Alphaproteobacteria bacterium]|nr:TIGR03016 family PEP-CTERM system-associated outer membrane protein [Alphaproteobacteria bacterium]